MEGKEEGREERKKEGATGKYDAGSSLSLAPASPSPNWQLLGHTTEYAIGEGPLKVLWKIAHMCHGSTSEHPEWAFRFKPLWISSLVTH